MSSRAGIHLVRVRAQERYQSERCDAGPYEGWQVEVLFMERFPDGRRVTQVSTSGVGRKTTRPLRANQTSTQCSSDCWVSLRLDSRFDLNPHYRTT
ncbi:hypothetical protein [Enterobacter phage 01_vB_Eclo_IJM]|nr:hypothetical protein [Enterobacter phage 01_vB_Eclo_IJM]